MQKKALKVQLNKAEKKCGQSENEPKVQLPGQHKFDAASSSRLSTPAPNSQLTRSSIRLEEICEGESYMF
ncbi:hypothetical protein PoB_003891600 [Plakobranchus ocellatus]|uniref:Uncharacterized protein n=1 Tax=Plakobranchus ocellatus TaxID=259542 RepID=A0AAV4AW45_9GAST|nr:hypothetical protein PoB_003891600 [Plakobranchus ocellatus]